MKAIIILIIFIWIVQPVKVVPVELRKEIDWMQYDCGRSMWYWDSSGKKIYYPDVTTFDALGKFMIHPDEAVGSANVFMGI